MTIKEMSPAEMLLAKERFPELPFKVFDRRVEKWRTPILSDFGALLASIGAYGGQNVKFDPDYKWPYMPETREGVPVWVKFWNSNKSKSWWVPGIIYSNFFYNFQETDYRYDIVEHELKVVAADPRSLTTPPPEDL